MKVIPAPSRRQTAEELPLQSTAILPEISHYRDLYSGKFSQHSHDFYELMFLLEGDIHIVIEGNVQPLRESEFIIIPPDVTHYTSVQSSTKIYDRFVIQISPSLIQEIRFPEGDAETAFSYLSTPCTIPCTGAYAWPICTILENAHAESQREPDRYSPILLKSYMQELLFLLARISQIHISTSAAPVHKTVKAAVEYINTAYTDPALTLETIAKASYSSVGNLSRLFKKEIGKTVFAYITDLRLGLAVEKLRLGSSVIDACYNSGFSDYTSFLKTFKKATNSTPREFIRQYFRQCR